MKVIRSDSFKKSYRNKKIQSKDRIRIEKLIQVLVQARVFSDLHNDTRAKMYRFEQLKHELSWAFSMRINHKEMR